MAEESKEKRIFHASNGDDYDLDAVLKDYDLNKAGYTQWAIYLDANSPFKKKKDQSKVSEDELKKAFQDVIDAANGNYISSWDGGDVFSINDFGDVVIDWNDAAHKHALHLYGQVLRGNGPMAKPTLWGNDNIGTIDYNNIIPSYSDQSWYGVDDATSRSNFAKIIDKEIADYQNNSKRIDFSNSPYANQQAYIDALTNFKELLTGGTDIASLRDLWLSLGGKNDVFDKWFGKGKPLPNYDYKAEIDSKIQAMKDNGVVLTEDEEKLLRESYEALGRALAMGLTNDDYAQFQANLLSNIKDNSYKLQLQSWRQQYKKPIRMTTGIMTDAPNSKSGAADRNLDKLLSDSNGKNAFDKFWNDLTSYFNGNSSVNGQELSKRTIKLGKNTYNISAYYGNLLNRLLLDLSTAAENFIPINDNEFIIKETIDRKTGSAIKYDRRSGTYTKYHVSPDSPALEEYLREAWSKDYDRKSRWSKNGGKLEKINMLRNGSILKAGLGDALNKEAKRVLDTKLQLNQEEFNRYKLEHPDATMQEFVRENKKASETKSRWYEDLRAGSTGLDVASAVASFAPVIGNAAGVIGGSVATIGNTIADLADSNVSWGLKVGNLALNALLTGAMLIPGGGTARLVKTAAKAAPIAIGAYSTVSNWDRLKELKNKWDNGTITNAEKRELSYLVQTASGTVVGTKYASAGAARKVASNGHTKIGKTLAFASDPLGVTYSSTFGKGNYTNDLVTTLKPVGDGKAHFEFTDSKGTRHSVSPLQYKAMIDARDAAINNGKKGLDISNAMLDAWAKNGPEGTYYQRTTTGIDNTFKFNDLNLNSTILNALKSKKDATKPVKISDDIELSIELVNQLRKAYQELKNKSDVKAIINRLNKELKNMNLPNRTNEPAINPNAPVFTIHDNATSKLNRLRNYVDRNRENEMFGMKDVKEFKEGYMDLFDQSTENGIYNSMLLQDMRNRYGRKSNEIKPLRWYQRFYRPNYEIEIEPYSNATRTPYDAYLENLEKRAKELYNNSQAHKQGGKLELLKMLRQGGEINFILPVKAQTGRKLNLDDGKDEYDNIIDWGDERYENYLENNVLKRRKRIEYGTNKIFSKNDLYDPVPGGKEAEADKDNQWFYNRLENDRNIAEKWARDYYNNHTKKKTTTHGQNWFKKEDGSFNYDEFLKDKKLWTDAINGEGHDVYRGKVAFVNVDGQRKYVPFGEYEGYTLSTDPAAEPRRTLVDEYELIAKPTDAQGDGLSNPEQQEGDKPQGGSQTVDASQIKTNPNETEPLSHWMKPYKYNEYLADALDLSGLMHSLWTNNRIAQIAKTKVPVLSSPKIGFKSIYGDFAALLHYNKQAADVLSKARRLADGTANTEAGFAAWLDAQRIANLLKETGHKVDNDMTRKDMAESDAIRRNAYDYNHDKGDANLASLTAQINYAKDIEQGRLNANFTSLNNYRMGLIGNLRHRFLDWQQMAGKLYLLRMLLWAKNQINNDPEYRKRLDAYEKDPNDDKNLTSLINYQRERLALLLPYINRQYMNLYAGKYTDDSDFEFVPYAPTKYEAKISNKPKSERRGGRIVVDSSRMKYRADDLRELRKLIRTNIRASLHALDNVSRATLLELKKMMGI